MMSDPVHRMRRIALAGPLAAALAVVPAAWAETELDDVTNRYDIRGTTAEELVREMGRRGPIGDNGIRYRGYTTWWIEPVVEEAYGEGGCGLTSLKVTAHIVYSLPNWTNRADGSDALRAKWDAYLDALSRHEYGHGNFAISAMNVLNTTLLGLPRRRNCYAMLASVKAALKKISGRFASEEDRYDRRTAHGKKDGVVFP